MGGIIAKRLFECYRDWALGHGVREVRVCVSTGVALESSHRLLTGMQMRHIGGHYSLTGS